MREGGQLLGGAGERELGARRVALELFPAADQLACFFARGQPQSHEHAVRAVDAGARVELGGVFGVLCTLRCVAGGGGFGFVRPALERSQLGGGGPGARVVEPLRRGLWRRGAAGESSELDGGALRLARGVQVRGELGQRARRFELGPEDFDLRARGRYLRARGRDDLVQVDHARPQRGGIVADVHGRRQRGERVVGLAQDGGALEQLAHGLEASHVLAEARVLVREGRPKLRGAFDALRFELPFVRRGRQLARALARVFHRAHGLVHEQRARLGLEQGFFFGDERRAHAPDVLPAAGGGEQRVAQAAALVAEQRAAVAKSAVVEREERLEVGATERREARFVAAFGLFGAACVDDLLAGEPRGLDDVAAFAWFQRAPTRESAPRT